MFESKGWLFKGTSSNQASFQNSTFCPFPIFHLVPFLRRSLHIWRLFQNTEPWGKGIWMRNSRGLPKYLALRILVHTEDSMVTNFHPSLPIKALFISLRFLRPMPPAFFSRQTLSHAIKGSLFFSLRSCPKKGPLGWSPICLRCTKVVGASTLNWVTW